MITHTMQKDALEQPLLISTPRIKLHTYQKYLLNSSKKTYKAKTEFQTHNLEY